jgi:hypothetical protein
VIDIIQEKQEGYGIYFLCLALFFLTIGLINNYDLFEGSGMQTITGKATTADATTSAIIANYFSVNASTNLTTDGIVFFISSLPAANKSAHGNGNGDATNASNTFLTVEHDSNVVVKFCIKANDSLRTGNYVINNINYWWSNSTTSNSTWPHLRDYTNDNRTLAYNFTGFNESFYGPANDVAVDGKQYFRFWLSAPANQNPGTYKNQVNFKGVQTGSACN